MNWLTVLLNPNLISALVAGIQAIHGDAKSGADKKTLALESLGLAEGAASVIVPAVDSNPNDAALATAAGSVAQAGIVDGSVIASKASAQDKASAIIDGAVAAFKLVGQFGFKPKPPATTPAAG
jgi:hypothetical protein